MGAWSSLIGFTEGSFSQHRLKKDRFLLVRVSLGQHKDDYFYENYCLFRDFTLFLGSIDKGVNIANL
jgi:hypothetical protein